MQFLLNGPSHFPVHWSSFPYSLSWYYSGLYCQLPPPSLSLSSQSIPVKSVCISPNLWLGPLGEKMTCLARFPSRSPQAPQVPWGGRRRWGRQQRTVVRVTDGAQCWPASVNVKTRLCWHLLSAAIFGWWKVSRGFQGLGCTHLLCAALPCSQAVCAGSWLAAGRDKRQKAGAGWLKCSTNRSTIYHYEPAKQRESQAYLISCLLS